jgi:NAD-dependent deacetylase
VEACFGHSPPLAVPAIEIRSEDQRLEQLLARIDPQRIVVITGAGISAESGIPTYRGEEGYWTETSANYQPEQTAYLSFFNQHPREVWRFGLELRRMCTPAQPNLAHHALVEIERAFADDFLLVTQNIDGLHLRAGNSAARTIEAHGSLYVMRPVEGEPTLLPIPDAVECPRRGEPLDDASFALLATADGRRTRPHTMFFDEPYDERLYRSDTAFAAAKRCELLIVIGTSGATAMPWHLAVHAREADAAIVVVDPEETPFAVHARNRERDDKGLWLRGPSTRWVPRIAELLVAQRGRPRSSPERSSTSSCRSLRPSERAELRLEPAAAPDDPDFASSHALAELLGRRQPRRIVVLTGAGISAESGLPTFRGPEGYWVVGPRAARPTTRAQFEADARATWAFHLHLRQVFAAAQPNLAHHSLARLEQSIGDDLCLITQNIDGLHRRAGNSAGRTYELHGSCSLMRAVEGDPLPIEIPAELPMVEPDAPLPEAVWDALVMPDGARARPHVLWWDEAYNEVQYRSESSLAAGRECDLLIVIGTSGAAALPYAITAQAVLEAGAALIDINPDDNPYAEHARDLAERGRGVWLRGTASRWVPEVVAQLLALRSGQEINNC